MGIDGFSQAQYNQLFQDVSSCVPPLPPSLVILLPLPPTTVQCKRKALDSGSEPDSDKTGADEVLEALKNPEELEGRILR